MLFYLFLYLINQEINISSFRRKILKHVSCFKSASNELILFTYRTIWPWICYSSHELSGFEEIAIVFIWKKKKKGMKTEPFSTTWAVGIFLKKFDNEFARNQNRLSFLFFFYFEYVETTRGSTSLEWGWGNQPIGHVHWNNENLVKY